MGPDEQKHRILPLVGRVIKKRLIAFGRQARRDLTESYEQFRRELEVELHEATREADAATTTPAAEPNTNDGTSPAQDASSGDEPAPGRVRIET